MLLFCFQPFVPNRSLRSIYFVPIQYLVDLLDRNRNRQIFHTLVFLSLLTRFAYNEKTGIYNEEKQNAQQKHNLLSTTMLLLPNVNGNISAHTKEIRGLDGNVGSRNFFFHSKNSFNLLSERLHTMYHLKININIIINSL